MLGGRVVGEKMDPNSVRGPLFCYLKTETAICFEGAQSF